MLGDSNQSDEKWMRTQREDPDLAPILRWLEDNSEQPSREEVAPEGPVANCLWEQWDTLGLDKGVLQKRWEHKGERVVWLIL